MTDNLNAEIKKILWQIMKKDDKISMIMERNRKYSGTKDGWNIIESNNIVTNQCEGEIFEEAYEVLKKDNSLSKKLSSLNDKMKEVQQMERDIQEYLIKVYNIDTILDHHSGEEASSLTTTLIDISKLTSSDGQRNQSEDTQNNKLQYFKCSFDNCQKIFSKESNLKDHLRVHTGERPYVCNHPGCSKSFTQIGNLKKHEKVHIGEKIVVCDFPGCGKEFAASYNLKIHYRCHTGETPYKCGFKNCNRGFYDKGNLKYHEKTSHAVELKMYPFSCDHIMCNMKFKTAEEKLSHHEEEEPRCLEEKVELIKMIQCYNNLIEAIFVDKKVAIDERNSLPDYKHYVEEKCRLSKSVHKKL